MNSQKLSEDDLKEILEIATEGEIKFKAMSDFATIMSEKWKRKKRNRKMMKMLLTSLK